MVYFELNKYEYIKKQTTNNNQPNEKKQQGSQKPNKAGWKPQKHIAQGSALGVRIENSKTPCKGKSIDN